MYMIPRIVVGTQYKIPLTPFEFDLIMYTDADKISEHYTLYNKLEVIQGIWGVDYNAHMGEYIYLSIDDEYDTGVTWDNIKDMIIEYIEDGYVS